jgi:hypothetical protein
MEKDSDDLPLRGLLRSGGLVTLPDPAREANYILENMRRTVFQSHELYLVFIEKLRNLCYNVK